MSNHAVVWIEVEDPNKPVIIPAIPLLLITPTSISEDVLSEIIEKIDVMSLPSETKAELIEKILLNIKGEKPLG